MLTAPTDASGTLVATPRGSARLSVVLLHGYSMTPADLAPFADSLALPAVFHFPLGPRVCVDGGACWWQAEEGRGDGPRDLAGAHPSGRDAARDALHETLRKVQAGWPKLPLVIGGFSQGAMLACDYLLQHPAIAPAGLVLLSGSRLAFDEWEPQLHRLRGLPVFAAHGQRDDDLSFAAGRALEAALRQAGARTTWLPFDGGHEIPLVVWRSLKKFLLALAP